MEDFKDTWIKLKWNIKNFCKIVKKNWSREVLDENFKYYIR